MDELHFLKKMQERVRIRTGERFENRFQVVKTFLSFMDQSVFAMQDEQTQLPCLMFTARHDADNGWRAANFLNFLSASSHIPEWPKLIKSFRFMKETEEGEMVEGSPYTNIVTTDRGEPLKQVRFRTNHISYENALRLCHQIFALLDKVHDLGYIHRSVDGNTLIGYLNSNNEFTVGLSGFWYTTRMDPAPQSDEILWNSASLHVIRGQPYTRIDDFISALYVVISFVGKNWFNGYPDYATRLKQELHSNPHRAMADHRLNWIGDLIEELDYQRVNGFDREAIQEHLTEAIDGFDLNSPFDWHFLAGTTDVKLNPIPVGPIGQPRGPIRVPHQ